MSLTQSPPPDDDVELFRLYEEKKRTCPWTVYPEWMVPAILPFHQSRSEIRLLLGGNGTSKTTTGSYEAVCFATGYNPIRNEHYAVPNEGWAVCLKLKDQGPVMREALWRMLPQAMGRDGLPRPGWRYFKQSDILEIKKGLPGAGSIIRLKQQEEGSESFFGGRPLWIWIDEEKAGAVGQRNFNQMMARRTPGQKLHILITMTPEHGYSWTWKRMVNPESEELIPGVTFFKISKFDCLKEKGGYIDREELEREAQQWPEEERNARIYGEFSPFGVSPYFQPRALLRAADSAPHGKRIEWEDRPYGQVAPRFDSEGIGTLIRERESGHEYLGVWDPSSGVGGDPSVFVVLDRDDLAEVFYAASNRMDPDYFALKEVLPACRHYNTAQLAVEVNGEAGGAALSAVRGYENLYYQRRAEKGSNEVTDSLGWRTTSTSMGGGTRSRIFDSLNRALRESTWKPSFELVQEMSHIVKVRNEKGYSRPDHPDGMHDDHVVAMGIALSIHYEEPVLEWPDFRRLSVRHIRYGGSDDYALVP